MRASTRRRITLALIGLLVLALIGWFVQDTLAAGATAHSLLAGGGDPTMLVMGNTTLERLEHLVTDADAG